LSLQVRNTRDYTNPDKFRMVALVYGLPGSGKTKWIGTCDPRETGIAACETGQGNGLLTIAELGFDHVIPENFKELEEICEGKVFKDKKVIVFDSLSAMARTIIKDTALKIPQNSDASRGMGVPSMRDYGVIASLTAGLLNKLLRNNPDKHILVTATEKYDKAGDNDPPGTESWFGPQLAGQMFTEAPALFDFVLRLRTRTLLKDPKDAKSKYVERFFQTDRQTGVIAKCRATVKDKPLLDPEEVFDVTTGRGTFPALLEKITRGYARVIAPEATSVRPSAV